MKHCATGRHIASAVLTVRKPGPRPFEYINMTMTNVLIASVATASGEERLIEHVVLKFAKVTFEYVPQKADGSGGTPVKMGWDIAAGREF